MDKEKQQSEIFFEKVNAVTDSFSNALTEAQTYGWFNLWVIIGWVYLIVCCYILGFMIFCRVKYGNK